MGDELDERRRSSRRVLDRLTVGERFMLMFGRGELKRDPLRVVPKPNDPALTPARETPDGPRR
jgi:hypothetical protein